MFRVYKVQTAVDVLCLPTIQTQNGNSSTAALAQHLFQEFCLRTKFVRIRII